MKHYEAPEVIFDKFTAEEITMSIIDAGSVEQSDVSVEEVDYGSF